jgi:hypothetical protein
LKNFATARSRNAALLLGMCFCTLPVRAIASAPNLRVDDTALIQHIKATDFVFRSLLGTCQSESLQRSVSHGLSHFAYKGTCAINPRPEEDCQSYHVVASGTVDTSRSATVRDIQLKLLCSA